MRILGFEITRAHREKQLSGVDSNRGWFPLIREAFAGAWQRNKEWSAETVLAHHAVWACVTLISNDVGKLRPKLRQLDSDGIWTETESVPYSRLLRNPNRFQNHIEFKEWWTSSKLLYGNTYALKERDNRGIVRALYLLDPTRVQVLVAPDGSIFYSFGQDNLAGVTDPDRTVPASEIIHDRINCLFHPLVGLSPIFASGINAVAGLNIQHNSSKFFEHGAQPSGILTAPKHIDRPTAEMLSERWRELYSGDNAGKVAVLGDDLKFQPLRMNAVDSQLIEQLKWGAETIASTFHVPPFKIGIGQMPTYQNGQTLNTIYYTDCLQSHIEHWELSMDDGLGLDTRVEGRQLGIYLDLDDLLRMDSKTQIETLTEGVGGAVYAPNEARRKINLRPLAGGDTVYLQEQNFSLAALNERDQDKPFARAAPSVDSAPAGGDGEATEQLNAAAINLKLCAAARERKRKRVLLEAA